MNFAFKVPACQTVGAVPIDIINLTGKIGNFRQLW